MDFSKLYLLGDAFIRGALRVSPGLGIDDMAIARAESLPLQPLVCRHHMGGKPRDLVGTSYATLDLLSDRVIQIFRDGGYTGWTTFPVEMFGKRGERIEGYHGFAVTGRCGPVIWAKGKKVRKPPRVPWGQSYDAWAGMYFDPDSWDGSDIFVPEATAYTIVVEKVMLALTKAKVTNIKFEPLTEFERSWPVSKSQPLRGDD
jgi:hypothetical protein